jgi:hypothetical protein
MRTGQMLKSIHFRFVVPDSNLVLVGLSITECETLTEDVQASVNNAAFFPGFHS